MSFNEDREAFLQDLEEKKRLDEAARIAALNKLQQQGLGQQLVSKESQKDGLSLNKRRFGPYNLTTILDTAHDSESGERRGQVVNEVHFKGGEHSDSDIKKIADELKEPGKPADYERFNKIIRALKPTEDESVVQSKTNISTNRPLWYNEEDDKIK